MANTPLKSAEEFGTMRTPGPGSGVGNLDGWNCIIGEKTSIYKSITPYQRNHLYTTTPDPFCAIPNPPRGDEGYIVSRADRESGVPPQDNPTFHYVSDMFNRDILRDVMKGLFGTRTLDIDNMSLEELLVALYEKKYWVYMESFRPPLTSYANYKFYYDFQQRECWEGQGAGEIYDLKEYGTDNNGTPANAALWLESWDNNGVSGSHKWANTSGGVTITNNLGVANDALTYIFIARANPNDSGLRYLYDADQAGGNLVIDSGGQDFLWRDAGDNVICSFQGPVTNPYNYNFHLVASATQTRSALFYNGVFRDSGSVSVDLYRDLGSGLDLLSRNGGGSIWDHWVGSISIYEGEISDDMVKVAFYHDQYRINNSASFTYNLP